VRAPILDPRAPAAAVPHFRVLGAPPRRTAGAKRGSESGCPTNQSDQTSRVAGTGHAPEAPGDPPGG